MQILVQLFYLHYDFYRNKFSQTKRNERWRNRYFTSFLSVLLYMNTFISITIFLIKFESVNCD
jgi:hypothetical protein